MASKLPAASAEHSRFPDGFRILQGKQEYITYQDHSSIRVWPSDVPSHFDVHMHSAVEVLMPHRGKALYQLPDRTYQVEAGQLLFIPPGISHALTESDDILRYLILFEPSPLYTLRDMPAVRMMTQQPLYLTQQDMLTDEICSLLMALVDCYLRKEGMWNTECYSFLLKVYALLGRQYLRRNTPPAPAERRSVDAELLNSAITYISENYMRPLTLTEVADFTGFSKYYFSRVFKDFAGLPFSSYLNVKRVNAAANLLINSADPVQEIARQAGFGSVASFNRLFREYKHCTPTQFRAIYSLVLPADQVSPFTE